MITHRATVLSTVYRYNGCFLKPDYGGLSRDDQVVVTSLLRMRVPDAKVSISHGSVNRENKPVLWVTIESANPFEDPDSLTRTIIQALEHCKFDWY
jgi:hypothetical protein